ncbi:MAG: hypothetical protein Q8942_14035, partial [Bacillota bacterium]|nr:hypothetical protein [Bacillota bacterium]
ALKDYKNKDKIVSKTKLAPNDFKAEVKKLSTYGLSNQNTTGKSTGGSEIVNEKGGTTSVLCIIASLLALALVTFLLVRKMKKGNVVV